MYNILICDDERPIVSALKIYLADENYRLFEAYDGEEALEVFRREDIHLILMDIMMPRLNGIEVMAKIRQTSNVPVILLSAKSEDADVILGLNVGADDYITKPFKPAEVAARVRSGLRRYMLLGGGSRQARLCCGNIELDDGAKQVTVDGEPVMLTPTEYGILKLLMENAGQVYSPDEIYRRVWHDTPFGGDGAVAVHIRNLRSKLEIEPSKPRYLKVVWGQGYKMEKEGNA